MKIQPKLQVVLALAALLSACASPVTSPPTVVPPAPTLVPTVDVAATTLAEDHRAATSAAATLAAQPTATEPPTATLVPTATPPPATATTAPTLTPAPTQVPPTRVVVATQAPPTATLVPATGSIYGWTNGGPVGYTSVLFCTQAGGVACTASMPPGDLNFTITLESAAEALEVIFYPFGLSVERDGVNVADMYITADAGWLPPASQARFGVSRTFSVPGHYVIRTNGCLFTQENWASGLCNWWTLTGTVATFDIQ